MWKTELLKKFGYSETVKCTEDIDLYFRFLEDGHSIYTLQEPLINFRITDSTFKRRSLSKSIQEFKIYWNYLHKFNGVSKKDILPVARFLSRLIPCSLNKKLYLSNKRQKLFKENVIQLKVFDNQQVKLNGNLYKLLFEFEERGEKKIKAVCVDSPTKCVVEIPSEKLKSIFTDSSIFLNL